MTDIKQYNFDTFTIIAPSKHATRWLSNVSNTHIYLTHTTDIRRVHWKRELGEKISNIVNKVYFVYRDPLDCFKSAICTFANSNTTIWKGDMDKLDIVMEYTNHFEPYYYETLYNVLESINRSDIEFVSLNNLKELVDNKLNKETNFKKENYSFPTTLIHREILGSVDTGIDIVSECELRQPLLWKQYMDMIEIDRKYLELLLLKYSL
jgi:hypothetical protein